ncbi:MAG TPA: SpoIIE family protein phosphatase [Vicinamibacterales bacterium]|nr:SpoIIE family protein phosphatase [Vicinamibacterales bacterium]
MILAGPLQVREASQTAQARRAAVAVAHDLGFDDHDAARVALVATEAATNLVRHGGGGEMLLLPLHEAPGPAVQILALDTGPGFALNVARRDGYSTTGTAGTGLGAIARASDLFSVYSRPGMGTALLSEVRSRGRRRAPGSRFAMGGFSVPKPGEQVCGDGWNVSRKDDVLTIVLVDGLGHGPGAAGASLEALKTFRAQPGLPPVEQIKALHAALHATRGAAAAVASVDARLGTVRFAGVGNTLGMIDGGERVRHLVSHNGTVGHELPRVQEFTYPWPPGSVLLMASDGLTTRLGLDGHPGLRSYPPALVAAVLYRDYRRGRDDATVLVVREDRTEGRPEEGKDVE